MGMFKMRKNKIYFFLISLIFIASCGKISQDLKESGVTVLDTRGASASNNTIDKIVSVF